MNGQTYTVNQAGNGLVVPVANFTGVPTNGVAPLAVTFTDTSTGPVTNRTWNFGDGGASTVANPSHTYTNAGAFSVGLAVFGPGGYNTTNHANYITVTSTNVLLDTTPPRLVILSPIDYKIFTNAGITVAGTAADASGIRGVTVNGSVASMLGTNWNAAATLVLGTNTLTVIATDNSAALNTATQHIHAVLSVAGSASNQPPVIIEGPTVTNALLTLSSGQIVLAGDTNIFTVGAIDSGGNTLSYRWQFGDGVTNGLSAVGTAAHVYSETNNCGPYQVNVTVSNHTAAVSSNLTVIVACDFLAIPKLQVGVNFAKLYADSISLKAKVGLPGLMNIGQLAGVPVVVDVGGVQVPFTLNNKGRGVSANGTCVFAYTKPTKQLPGYWTATITLSKGNWRNQWVPYGLDNTTHKTPGIGVILPVVVVIGNEAFTAEPQLHYTATQNKTGTAK